jgi:hypothetical protein
MTTGEVIALIKAFGGGGGGGSSGGGVLVVNMVYDEVKDAGYTDKTWKEIHDVPMAVIVDESSIPSGRTIKSTGYVVAVEHNGSEYSVSFYTYSPGGEITAAKLVTDSENGYLTWE